jgi:hypothetical protein
MKPLLTAAIFAQFLTVGMAQLPTTNVYLFSIQRTGDNFTFYNPRFLTGFNKYGYNNQPHFVSNNEIYLTVGLVGEPMFIRFRCWTMLKRKSQRQVNPNILLRLRLIELFSLAFGLIKTIFNGYGNIP